MTKRSVLGALLVCAVTFSGCSYGGIATNADGSIVFIALNGGAQRRIYKCDVSPTTDELFVRCCAATRDLEAHRKT